MATKMDLENRDYWFFAEVLPKDGIMKEIHEDVIWRTCYIMYMKIGESALIKFEPEYDPGYFHTMHTSRVEEYEEDGDRVKITTKNTVYVMERLNDTAKQ